jgi:hypothetical protein
VYYSTTNGKLSSGSSQRGPRPAQRATGFLAHSCHGLGVDAFAEFDGCTATLAIDQTSQGHLAAAFLRAARQSGHEPLHLNAPDRGGVLE